MKPVGIIIHHSLTKDGKTEDWASIKRYHMEEKGWADIGYHAGVERVDDKLTALTGRPLNMQGAHCEGHNDTIGICVVGNFDLAPPDGRLLDYAAMLVAGFLRMYPFLGINDIHKHHEYAAKSCPGTKFPWKEFLRTVEAGL